MVSVLHSYKDEVEGSFKPPCSSSCDESSLISREEIVHEQVPC